MLKIINELLSIIPDDKFIGKIYDSSDDNGDVTEYYDELTNLIDIFDNIYKLRLRDEIRSQIDKQTMKMVIVIILHMNIL